MTEFRGLGRTLFAAVLLVVGGILNVIWGIAAISNSSFFVHNQQYIFSTLKGWGWITLIIGILQLLAGFSLFGGGAFGRWFGIVMGSFAALDALLDIPAYPFWSIAAFALSLWIVHGLCVFDPPAHGEYPAPGADGYGMPAAAVRRDTETGVGA